MKKMLSLVMVCLFGLAMLTACGGGSSSSVAAASSQTAVSSAAGSDANESATAEKLTVGIVQIVEHPSLDEIRTAIIEQFKAKGYGDDRLTIDYQNAQGDMNTVNSICQKFVGDKVDLIIAIATPSAQGAAAATSDIPIVFSAVSDPLGAGLVENFDKPEGNITGTADVVPVDQIFAMAAEMVPSIKTYGFIYNLSEANSVTNIGLAKEYCDANGLKYVEATVNNSNEVQQAAQSLIGQVDAIFSPTDNTVASAMPILSELCIKAKLPAFVGADSMVNDGGLATVSVDYTRLGQVTTDMAIRILEGAEVSDVPVDVITEYATVVNEETAKAIGVDVSKFIK